VGDEGVRAGFSGDEGRDGRRREVVASTSCIVVVVIAVLVVLVVVPAALWTAGIACG